MTLANTTTKRIPLKNALGIAEHIVSSLEPYCERIEIAGSIRRQSKTVKDIELVLIPKLQPSGKLFGGQPERNALLLQFFENWKRVNKSSGYETSGNPKTDKYLKLWYKIPIDIYIVDQDNWGYLLALRTGSPNFNFKILKAISDSDYKVRDGYVYNQQSTKVQVKTEAAFFELIGLPWLEPEER